MAITVHGDGGMSITGEESIKLARMLTQLHALKGEGFGIRYTRGGPSVLSMVKKEYNLKGNRDKVFTAFAAIVQAYGAEHRRMQDAGEI